MAHARRLVRDALRDGGIDSADLDARLLLQQASGLDHAALLHNGTHTLDSAAIARLTALTMRRLAHEPVAYILDHKGFGDLTFAVGPGVLIPRPDSECVVALALAHQPRPRRVLDLGVGPGTLLLSILHASPDAHGVGVDVSDVALDYAQRNAQALGLSERCTWRQGDWQVAAGSGPYDLIISNPPYIARHEITGLQPDVRDHEPHLALDGGADGLDPYRQLAPLMASLLAPGGHAVLEIGHTQAEAVTAICAASGLARVAHANDLGGICRGLCLRAP